MLSPSAGAGQDCVGHLVIPAVEDGVDCTPGEQDGLPESALVQRLLAAKGYRPGAIDGRLNPETVEAIRSFEQAQGLVPAKGRISAEVYVRLQDTTKLKSAEAR